MPSTYDLYDPNLGFVPQGNGIAPMAQYHEQYDPATNPYAWNRYGYAGPQFRQGQPQDNLNMGYGPYYGGDISKMAENNRSMALTGGQSLGNDLYNYANYNYGMAGQQQNRLDSAYSETAQGRGGYTDAQKAAILNNPALQGLQLTPEQMQGNYLSAEEQGGIRGNPYQAFNYSQEQGGDLNNRFNDYAGQIGADMGSQEESINRTLGGSGDVMRNAVYDHQRKSYDDLSDIAALTRGEVGDTRSNVRNSLGYSQGLVGEQLNQTSQRLGSALGSQAQGVRSYIDPEALTTSDEYNQNYQVGQGDMQGIVNQAGRQVGAQSAMDEERLSMDANSQGNYNPMAMATMRNRIRSTSAVNQANAMADAAIKAKQLQLQTSQGRENTRLGAEQSYAGMGAGAEMGLGAQQVGAAQQYGNTSTNAALGLGNQAVSAEYGLGSMGLGNEHYMGSNTLSQQNNLAGTQLGAEQFLASQNLAGQQYLGNSRLQNTQQLMNTGLGVQQYNSNLGMNAIQQGEQNASSREGTLANTRLAGNQYNQGNEFQRGQYIYGQGSNANLGFANTQLQNEKEYRDYLAGSQNQFNQNATVGNQQRLGAYSATNQGVQGATSGAIENYKVPGMGERIANLIPKYIEAGASGIRAATGGRGFKTGGTIKGPTNALIGEAGPELLIDLAPDQGGGYSAPGSSPYGDIASPLYSKLVKDTYEGGEEKKEMAGGGMVGKHHFYGSKRKLKGAPKMRLVTKPTVTTLGVKGPQAVVPLTPRKSNKLNVSDIPSLIKKYSRR